jgi:hypothetical protein
MAEKSRSEQERLRKEREEYERREREEKERLTRENEELQRRLREQQQQATRVNYVYPNYSFLENPLNALKNSFQGLSFAESSKPSPAYNYGSSSSISQSPASNDSYSKPIPAFNNGSSSRKLRPPTPSDSDGKLHKHFMLFKIFKILII